MMPLPLIESCDGCGACCEHVGYPPVLAIQGEPDWEAIIGAGLDEEVLRAIDERRGDRGLPCIWYDEQTHRCRHHDLRPSICREFEMGGEDCRRLRNQVLLLRKGRAE